MSCHSPAPVHSSLLSMRSWMLPHSDQSRAASLIFGQYPVYSSLFPVCSPGSLVKLARTCQTAHNRVREWSAKAYSINSHLSRFFLYPILFRKLQAHTGTLVSGSNAFQFFERTYYEESDIDVYVHPGHGQEVGVHLMKVEGYDYFGTCHHPSEVQVDGTGDIVDFSIDEIVARESSYLATSVHDVLRFGKIDSEGRRLNLHLVLTMSSPFETILRFHSSESSYRNARTDLTKKQLVL